MRVTRRHLGNSQSVAGIFPERSREVGASCRSEGAAAMRLSQSSRPQGTKEKVKFRRPQNAGHFLGTVWALMPKPSFVPGWRKGSAPHTWT